MRSGNACVGALVDQSGRPIADHRNVNLLEDDEHIRRTASPILHPPLQLHEYVGSDALLVAVHLKGCVLLNLASSQSRRRFSLSLENTSSRISMNIEREVSRERRSAFLNAF